MQNKHKAEAQPWKDKVLSLAAEALKERRKMHVGHNCSLSFPLSREASEKCGAAKNSIRSTLQDTTGLWVGTQGQINPKLLPVCKRVPGNGHSPHSCLRGVHSLERQVITRSCIFSICSLLVTTHPSHRVCQQVHFPDIQILSSPGDNAYIYKRWLLGAYCMLHLD